MTHYGFDVFDFVPSFSDAPRMMIQATGIQGLMNEKAPGVISWPERRPLHSFNFNFQIDGAAQIGALLKFFNSRAGSHQAFWLPSWHPELRLAAPITDSGHIDIVAIGYQSVFLDAGEELNQESGRNLFFYDHRGNLVARRVVDVISVSDSVERLVLDSALPTEIMQRGKIGQSMIGLLNFCRFAEDSLSVKFVMEDYAQMNIGFVELIKSYTEPATIWYWNEAQTASCGEYTEGSSVTVKAKRFISTVSVEDANAKALAYATSKLVCIPIAPDFVSCGLQNWYPSGAGTPYSNSGNTTSGLSWLHASALTVTGGVLTGATIDQPYDYILVGTPSIVSGDFTASLEVEFTPTLARGAMIGLIDQDSKMMGYGSIVNDGTLLIRRTCDMIGTADNFAGYDSNDLAYNYATSTSFGAGWNTLQLKRVGTVITFTLNGVDSVSHDFNRAIIGRVVFGYNGNQGITWSTRNISITTP